MSSSESNCSSVANVIRHHRYPTVCSADGRRTEIRSGTTWMRPRCLSLIALVLVGLPLVPARQAVADNWPGWRNDGSGISDEANIPVQWSTSENVRWTTPIQGDGHSSPIVWGDQVFITAVNPTVDRNSWVPWLYLLMTLLCGLVLWRLTDGTFGDPLGNQAHLWSGSESIRTRMVRRISVLALFVILGYGTVVVAERAYDALEIYPESLRNRLLDKTWYFTDAPGYQELATPISPFRFVTGKEVEGPFFSSPRIPFACYYGGAIAILGVLGVNTAIARRRKHDLGVSNIASSPSSAKRLIRARINLVGLDFRFGLRAEHGVGQMLRLLVDGIACLVTGIALLAVHSAAMADLPYVPSGTTWFLTVAIGVLALIAFNLLLPGQPWIRVLGLLISGGVLFYWFTDAPPNEEFGVFATAQRAGLRPLVKLFLALVALGLTAAWITPLREKGQAEPLPMPRRVSATLAACGILCCGLIYFLSANFLLPQSVFAREIISFDRRTGDVLWTARCDSGDTISELHAANSMATPTPVTDGKHVYAHFGDAGVYCVTMEGKPVWEFDEPVPPSHWGPGSSLVLWKDLLYLTCDSDHVSMTVAIDKENGLERWRAERTSRIEPSQLYDGYSTPIVLNRDGQDELVHVACQLLIGYDAATGQQRWVLKHPGEQPVATPVVSEDLVVILGGKYSPYMAAVDIQGEGDEPEPKIVWEATRNLSDMPSPVAYEGLIYMITKDGIASCIDARTGKNHWRHRMKGAYWASVLAADGKVYFCNAGGTITVIAAGPEYEELSRNELDGDVYASPAISNGNLFVRTSSHLICIGHP